MTPRFDGKVALISGGAQGQGAAEATAIVAEGGSVVIGDIADAKGETLASSLGDAAVYQHLDVRDSGSWGAAVETAVQSFGQLTTLVNNAGVLHQGGVLTTSESDYRAVMDVNQVGCFLGMQACAPAMSGIPGAAIVNIASVGAMVGFGNMIAYSASKWAVRGMTKSAALEFAEVGIRVNAVMPGSVRTQMLHQQIGDIDESIALSVVPMQRAAAPEEVAKLVLFLASDDSSYCTGQDFVIEGGSLAGFLMPPPAEV